MSGAGNGDYPQGPHDEHCSKCGAGIVNWGKWSKIIKKPDLRIKVTDIAGMEREYGTQQARFAIVLNQVGREGLNKAQMPGLHVSHYAKVMRDDGFAVTTTMIPTKWPWAGKYGLYRLEERLVIEDITEEYKARKATKTRLKPDKKKPAQDDGRASENPNTQLEAAEVLDDF